MNSLVLSKKSNHALTQIDALFDPRKPLDSTMPDFREDAEFVAACENSGVCLCGRCVAHGDAAEDEESDEHLWRLYLSASEMDRDWVTSADVTRYVAEMFASDDFRRNVLDGMNLKASDACGRVSLVSDGTDEYSVVNGMQPYVYKKKNAKHGVMDHFFSVGVAHGDDLTVVVPRSLITAVHYVEKKKKLFDEHGVPKPLQLFAELHGADFAKKVKKSEQIDIFSKKDEKVGSKRKNEVCRTLGVVSRVMKYKVKTESVKIRNPSSLVSYDGAEFLDDIMKLPADDDEEEEEEASEKDESSDEESNLRDLLGFATDRVDRATLRVLVNQPTVEMCFSPIKNCHHSVDFGTSHYVATVFDSECNDRLLQLLVVVKRHVDSHLGSGLHESPGLVDEGRGVFAFSEEAVCFLMPPALTELHGPMTTGKVSAYTLKQDGKYKAAATREFFADFRIGFLLNTHETFDAVTDPSYDLAVFYDLVHRIHGNKRKVNLYLQELERMFDYEKDTIDACIQKTTAGHDDLLEMHKTRMIAATASGVQLVSGIKRLYSQWHQSTGEKADVDGKDEEEDEEETQTAMNTALCVFGYVVDDVVKRGFSDDDRMVFHHDKKIVDKINEAEVVEREAEASRARDAVLFVKIIEKRMFKDALQRVASSYLPSSGGGDARKLPMLTETVNSLPLAASNTTDTEEKTTLPEQDDAKNDEEEDSDIDSDIDPDE